MYALLLSIALSLLSPPALAKGSAEAGEALLFDRGPTWSGPLYMDTLIDPCVAQEPGACQYLLQVIMNNSGNFQADIRRMATSISATCDAGDQAACTLKARAMLHGFTQPETTTVIREILDKACDAKVPEACSTIIESILLKDGSESAKAEAKALAEKSCKTVGSSACYSKSAILMREFQATLPNPSAFDESKFPQDKKDAVDKAIDRACQTGSAIACWAQAQQAFGSGDPPVDAKKARAGFKKACDLGYGMACHNLAWALRKGTGGDKGKPEEVAKLFIKSCGLKDDKACHRLPDERDIHRPVLEAQSLLTPYEAKDDPHGFDAPLKRLICDYFESPEGCFNLGYALNNQAKEVEKIVTGADEATYYMQRGCVMGSDAACRVMGHFLKATHRGCAQQKEPSACAMSGFHHKQGGWMLMYMNLPPWPDYRKAAEVFGVACEQDVAHTCDLQAAMAARAKAETERTEYHMDRRGRRGARKAHGPVDKLGKATGEWVMWFPTGAIYANLTYKDGELNGPATLWADTGKKESQGKFKSGRSEGVWRYWSPDGQETTTEWRHNMPYGTYTRIKPDGTTTTCTAKGNKDTVTTQCARKDGSKFSESVWTPQGRKSLKCWDSDAKPMKCDTPR